MYFNIEADVQTIELCDAVYMGLNDGVW